MTHATLLDRAAERGIIAPWYSFDGQLLGQGRANAILYLQQNPRVARELEARVGPDECGAAREHADFLRELAEAIEDASCVGSPPMPASASRLREIATLFDRQALELQIIEQAEHVEDTSQRARQDDRQTGITHWLDQSQFADGAPADDGAMQTVKCSAFARFQVRVEFTPPPSELNRLLRWQNTQWDPQGREQIPLDEDVPLEWQRAAANLRCGGAVTLEVEVDKHGSMKVACLSG